MSSIENHMSLVAILEGTWLRPELRFAFGWGAKLNGVAAQTWVKNLPGRRWDKEQGCWFITGTGGHPDRAFAARGIAVDFSQAEGDLSGLTELEPLWRPEVRYSKKFPDHAFVYPRLAGFEKVSGILGPGAVWEKARQRFQVRLTDLIDAEGNPKRGLQSADRAIEPAARLRAARELPAAVAESARYLASTTGFDPEDGDNPVLSKTAKHHIDIVSQHTGRLPEWFGLALYPFQECGAYAAAAGFNMLCDEPGLGKTRSALAAAAITGSKRVLVLCPPLVLTNWAREASTALGPGIRARRRSGPRVKPQPQAVRRPGKRTPKQPDPYGTVIVRPGRKVPEFPDDGVLIVAYSLITARPELLDQVVQWGADAVLVDESHYLRTWTSGRGSVVRRLAATIDGLRLPMTGTPMLSNPAELANQMAISGHLDPVFGGASNYLERFTREDPFGGRKPVKRELKHLRAVMDSEVWTRRNKGDVLLSLPGKLRAVRMVEVDNRAFEKAHDELYEKLELWVDEHRAEHGNSPDEETVRSYARSNVGLLSPLRRAAGMSKVPAAIEIITDWMEQTTSFDPAGEPVYERPLVVWAHHHEVLAALRDAIPEGMSAAVIDGSTTSDERARLADEFQAGRIGVLICSIIAAGFGITLTRGSDAIFVETDWTPAHISQAEDRNNRIGQVSRVTATTLIAPDTLDLQVRAVLRNKAETLNEVVVGADNNVARSDLTQGSDGAMWETTPEEEALAAELPDKHAIIVRIVEDILRERAKKPARGKKKIAV